MKTRNGWVEIDGIRYDHDVIIHSDRSVTKRHKKQSKKFKDAYGHTPLSEGEIGFLAGEHPAVVYVRDRPIRGSSTYAGCKGVIGTL